MEHLNLIEIIRLIANGSAALAVIVVVSLFLKFMRQAQNSMGDIVNGHIQRCNASLDRNTEAIARGTEAVARMAEALSCVGDAITQLDHPCREGDPSRINCTRQREQNQIGAVTKPRRSTKEEGV